MLCLPELEVAENGDNPVYFTSIFAKHMLATLSNCGFFFTKGWAAYSSTGIHWTGKKKHRIMLWFWVRFLKICQDGKSVSHSSCPAKQGMKAGGWDRTYIVISSATKCMWKPGIHSFHEFTLVPIWLGRLFAPESKWKQEIRNCLLGI